MFINIVSFLLSFILLLTPTVCNAQSFNEGTKEFNWYYRFDVEPKVPQGPKETPFISNHNVFFCGDTSQKEIFLTFDEGYENGNSGKILDILKVNGVKAAFFVTKPYITQNPDLIKRMEEEGHLVCNHTSHHPSMASITDFEKFKSEFTAVEEEYTKLTGKEMPKFFRPPMGKYSELSLKYTDDLGYSSIFWSFAYKDWLIKEQPSKEMAIKKILSKAHNGEIALLHAVSDTNTSILDEVLKELQSQGYVFKPLTELKKVPAENPVENKNSQTLPK